MRRQGKKATPKHKVQKSMSFVDTFVGIVILVIVTTGVVELFGMAFSSQKAQAAAAARTIELAHEKMEQILKFCGDSSHEAAAAGKLAGAGLAGCDPHINGARIPAIGGALDTSDPAMQYVDYLDASGTAVSPNGDWQYIRVWQVSIPPSASAGNRQIAVKAQARVALAGAPAAESTIVTSRSFPVH